MHVSTTTLLDVSELIREFINNVNHPCYPAEDFSLRLVLPDFSEVSMSSQPRFKLHIILCNKDSKFLT